ncbi:ArsR family transcriptional regulator [Paraburkholderia bannensis]|uniref:ArsR family transcriptional regulator n=1 Tax=Paraburkholderia bannensis TaxID=765414 RepID=A0A7W9U1K1_9BURK|nr:MULTISPECIES: helix-turn-helix domain-containing protein [Paraburkholderia]MBB3260087.1 ArsR family transcriptional regulator [Paraburkholderia sp. WP4_3_2]MBB6105293.1 ArsR family transcriptional regulator [Paraburkholderia bannensis]
MNADLIHKALANPLRREILAWLKTPREAFAMGYIDLGHGVPVSAIQQRSGLAQSTISAHLATLVDASLLVTTRVGQWTFLARNEALIRAFAAQLHRQL